MDSKVDGDKFVCSFINGTRQHVLRMQIPFSSVQHLHSVKENWVHGNVRANNIQQQVPCHRQSLSACMHVICLHVGFTT